MQNTRNTLPFVQSVMQRLAHSQVMVWLAGGWAEELWGLRSPREHRDIDLLYPSAHFAQVDLWLARTDDLSVIPGKLFSHKRAFLCEGVMVELLLLEPQPSGYITNFFDGRYQLTWPDDTLSALRVGESSFPVVSGKALQEYRRHNLQIARSFQAYLQAQRQL